MNRRVAAALVLALLALSGCEDDGASVRDLGGSASGSGSGSGSGTGTAPGSATEATVECLDDKGDPGLLVRLDEFSIVPEEDELTSGPTRLILQNSGELDHEFVVVQSPNVEALPLDGDNGVDEEALNPGQVIAQVDAIPAGEVCRIELDFEPATYVVFCNIVDEGDKQPRSHFLRGMRARFKV